MILFGIGIFYVILPFTPLVQYDSVFDTALNVFLGLLFIGFGILTRESPKLAILIPLILIIAYYLFLGIEEPRYILSGFIWKVLILSALIKGFVGVRKADNIIKENDYLASTIGYGKKEKLK